MKLNTNFTLKLRHAIGRAPALASALGHKYIGSEHLLLALCEEKDSLAAHFLESRGISLDRLTAAITDFSGTGTPTSLTAADMTPRARQMIEIAAETGDASGAVGSDSLLFVILSEKDSTAARLLSAVGIDTAELCRDIRHFHEEKEKKQRPSSVLLSMPKLAKFGRDLTAAARAGELDPLIGREEETTRVISVLCRRTKNNPCLIGEPGVGKTAIAEGLAGRIVRGTVPKELRDAAIVTLDLSSMIAGAKYRGEFEDRLRGVLDEVRTKKNVILFIDELHMIVGAGAAEGAVDAANILKPSLSRGEIRIFGATTPKEFHTSIEKDAALSRRFAPIHVREPSEGETLAVLRGLKPHYETHHGLRFSEDALAAAVSLSVRYLPERFLPDKAIDLLDEAAADKRVKTDISPLALRLGSKDVTKTRIENSDAEIGAEDIARILYKQTGIPVSRLTEDEGKRFSALESALKGKLIGQEDAIHALCHALLRRQAGFGRTDRPLGCFLFLGKTGVGKTAMCRALAEHLFGEREGLLRFDMSEYMEKHAVSRLIGSPPGYVGYGEGGLLTEGIRRRPYSVVLFDEIEKAHPDICHLFLQIMEEGRLTDSEGRTCNFCNAVIVFTSNIGASPTTHIRGLTEGEEKQTDIAPLRAVFRPEFLSRLDEIIRFADPEKQTLTRIAEGMLSALASRALAGGLQLSFSEEVAPYLAAIAEKAKEGARGVRRALTREIEDALATALLSGKLEKGGPVHVSIEEGHPVFGSV